MIECICKQCGNPFMARAAHVNRNGNPFCSRRCHGLSRRKPPMPIKEKKRLKAEYDRAYREKNKEMLRDKKAAYHRSTYDPEKARIERRGKMARHVEYCRKYYADPVRKAEKKDYDRKFRAKKQLGEFWEAHYLIQLINDEILRQTTKYEVMLEKGTLNKALKRGRRNENTKRRYA